MLRTVSDIEIRKILAPIPIRELGNKIVITNEYVVLTLYVNSTINGQSKTAYFTTEIHLVDNLKTNLLINNDILIL